MTPSQKINTVDVVLEDQEELFSQSSCPEVDKAIWSIMHHHQEDQKEVQEEIEKLIPNNSCKREELCYDNVPSLKEFVQSRYSFMEDLACLSN